MEWWIWVLLGFLLLAIEMMSTTAHIGFFAAGAFVVAAMTGFGWSGPFWQQAMVFTVVSLLALLVFRPVIIKKLRLNETKAVDQLVGEQATLMEDIPAQGRGKAEMRGSAWNAENVGNTPLVRGQRVRVERVEGLMLYIKG